MKGGGASGICEQRGAAVSTKGGGGVNKGGGGASGVCVNKRTERTRSADSPPHYHRLARRDELVKPTTVRKRFVVGIEPSNAAVCLGDEAVQAGGAEDTACAGPLSQAMTRPGHFAADPIWWRWLCEGGRVNNRSR